MDIWGVLGKFSKCKLRRIMKFVAYMSKNRNKQQPDEGTPPALIRSLCLNKARVKLLNFLKYEIGFDNSDLDTIKSDLENYDFTWQNLANEADVSEGAVSNIMGEFQEQGFLIQYSGDDGERYRFTYTGGLILKKYFELIDVCDSMGDAALQEFLNKIPDWDENLFDLDILENYEIESQSQRGSNYNSARRKYRELVMGAEKIRELVHQPFVPETFVNKDDVEFIINSNLKAKMEDDELIQGAKYSETDREIPYTLSIFDEQKVGILPPVENDPNILFYSSDPDVVEWAQKRYKNFQD